MVEGKRWDETQWNWRQAILKFRKLIIKSDEDIFGGGKGSANEIDSVGNPIKMELGAQRATINFPLISRDRKDSQTRTTTWLVLRRV